jgi:hypothetical protein
MNGHVSGVAGTRKQLKKTGTLDMVHAVQSAFIRAICGREIGRLVRPD